MQDTGLLYQNQLYFYSKYNWKVKFKKISYMLSKSIKYLRIYFFNLQYVHTKTFNKLFKFFSRLAWMDLFMGCRVNAVWMPTLQKLIYIFNVIPNEYLNCIICGKWQAILKIFMWMWSGNLTGGKQSWKITEPDTYCAATVMKTVWHQHQDGAD